jgi:hypothetical protein
LQCKIETHFKDFGPCSDTIENDFFDNYLYKTYYEIIELKKLDSIDDFNFEDIPSNSEISEMLLKIY